MREFRIRDLDDEFEPGNAVGGNGKKPEPTRVDHAGLSWVKKNLVQELNSRKSQGEETMLDRSLEIARRTKGREVFVNSWAVEKLVKVGEALAQLTPYTAYLGQAWEDQDSLWEAWRNVAKLTAWMGGNIPAYDEEAVRAVFEEGEAAMLRHLAASDSHTHWRIPKGTFPTTPCPTG